MPKPRIAIVTTLTDTKPSYSLVGVILDLARMLLRNGYPFHVVSLKNFNAEDRRAIEAEGIPWRFVLSQVRDHEYRADEGPHETTDKEVGFEDQVKILLDGDPKKGTIGYREALKDYDVIISVDQLFLSWFLSENKALRTFMAEHPEKNYLHYINSAPSPRPANCVYPSILRFQEAPGTFIFLNETQRHDAALMMGTTRNKVAVVYNARDLRDLYNFSEETNALLNTYDLFNFELLQIYPFSTPRWRPKGVRQLITLFAEWKKTNTNARLVLVNANANSAVDQPTVNEIKSYVASKGLTVGKEVILTSDFAEEMAARAESQGKKEEARKWMGWKYCVPARTVRELNLLANIFIFTSDTECCSLIQAEAAVSGKFMVLNRDFPPMLEFASRNTMTFEFKKNDPDDSGVIARRYYECVAREILLEFRNESSMTNATLARTKVYNRDWVFLNQIEPLLWKGYHPTVSPSEAVISLTDKTKEPPRPAGPTLPPVETLPPVTVPPRWPPQTGDPCPVYKTSCTNELRAKCVKDCGKCPLEDEVRTTE